MFCIFHQGLDPGCPRSLKNTNVLGHCVEISHKTGDLALAALATLNDNKLRLDLGIHAQQGQDLGHPDA